MQVDIGVDTVSFFRHVDVNKEGLLKRGFVEHVVSSAEKGKAVKYTRSALANVAVYKDAVVAEVSLPKLVSACDNVVPVSFDLLREKLQLFEDVVDELVGERTGLVSQGRPCRIDCCFDFQGVGGRRQYVAAFGQLLAWPRGDKAVYNDGETSFAWTKSFAIRLYDKELESQSYLAQDRMRLEVSLRGSRGIARFLVDDAVPGRESVVRELAKKLCVNDICDLGLARRVVDRVKARIFKEGDFKVRIKKSELLMRELAERYSWQKASRIFYILSFVDMYGWEAAKKYLSERSYYRLKRELIESGFLKLFDELHDIEVDFAGLFMKVEERLSAEKCVA